MADLKISQLTAATTPLAGSEVVPVLQGGANRKATAAQVGAPAVATHEAALDPHPQYLTQGEGDGRYATLAQGTDAREWTADTISQAEAEAGTATTRRAFTALRVFQAVAAWWAGSAAATKLAGIASGATANATDAQLRDRSTHTGTQGAGTITGLSAVATTGAYADLSGRPTLGTAAALDTGITAGKVVVLDGTGKLPAVDGSQLSGLPAQGVTSVGLSAPAGFSVSGSPITSTGTLSLSFAAGYSLPTTAKQSQWDTAYAGYLQWDGGATGLNAATARTSLGLGTAATTAASAYATAAQGALADTAVQPAGLSSYLTSATAASTYQPLDADLTAIAALTTTTFGRSLLTQADAAAARTTIGAGTGSGTVTSVGLSLPGLFSVSGSPVTSSGTLTAALATQAAGRVLAGPTTGADAAPTFRSLVAGDLGTTLSPQFAFLGIGAAASALYDLVLNGAAIVRHQSVTIGGSIYTFDVGAASEFTCGAAINGATTFALSNHDQLPAASGGVGWRARAVITFTWTSGAITFSATGYTFSQAAVTLTSGQTYNAILTMTSSSTVIGVQYTLGRS